MSEDISITERLKQESTLKSTITEAVNSICMVQKQTYPNICDYCDRSESDKNSIINNIFELMIQDNIQCTLLGAVSQVESKLSGWGE